MVILDQIEKIFTYFKEIEALLRENIIQKTFQKKLFCVYESLQNTLGPAVTTVKAQKICLKIDDNRPPSMPRFARMAKNLDDINL